MSILLPVFTFLLVIVSLLMVLVILAQRTKSDGGVGAGLGGGMAEAAFGAESGNVLTKSTQVFAVTFFVLAFALYLGHIHESRKAKQETPNSVAPSGSDFAPTPGANAVTPPATPGPEGAAPAINAPAPAPSTPVVPQPEAPQPAAPAPGTPAPVTP